MSSAALALAIASPARTAVAADPQAGSIEAASVPATESPEQDARAPRKNAILATAAFPFPDYGTGLTYLRALGRRYSVSAGLEYTAPRKGYAHLVGLSQTLGGQVWITRPLHGVWAGGSLTIAETFFSGLPELRRVAVAAGVNAGFSWQFRFGLLLGASGSLRFARSAGGSELVCSRADVCPATRGGIYARLGLDLGWAF